MILKMILRQKLWKSRCIWMLEGKRWKNILSVVVQQFEDYLLLRFKQIHAATWKSHVEV